MTKHEWSLYHSYYDRMKLILISYVVRRGKGWAHWTWSKINIIQRLV